MPDIYQPLPTAEDSSALAGTVSSGIALERMQSMCPEKATVIDVDYSGNTITVQLADASAFSGVRYLCHTDIDYFSYLDNGLALPEDPAEVFSHSAQCFLWKTDPKLTAVTALVEVVDGVKSCVLAIPFVESTEVCRGDTWWVYHLIQVQKEVDPGTVYSSSVALLAAPKEYKYYVWDVYRDKVADIVNNAGTGLVTFPCDLADLSAWLALPDTTALSNTSSTDGMVLDQELANQVWTYTSGSPSADNFSAYSDAGQFGVIPIGYDDQVTIDNQVYYGSTPYQGTLTVQRDSTDRRGLITASGITKNYYVTWYGINVASCLGSTALDQYYDYVHSGSLVPGIITQDYVSTQDYKTAFKIIANETDSHTYNGTIVGYGTYYDQTGSGAPLGVYPVRDERFTGVSYFYGNAFPGYGGVMMLAAHHGDLFREFAAYFLVARIVRLYETGTVYDDGSGGVPVQTSTEEFTYDDTILFYYDAAAQMDSTTVETVEALERNTTLEDELRAVPILHIVDVKLYASSFDNRIRSF